MPYRSTHISQHLKAAATLLLLLLCVCSAVARDTTRVFSKLPWGENLVAGDGYLSYYTYGHDGNRAIKMTGSAAIDQTGTLLNSTDLENITIYPNEYLTVTQGEYTKYYYAGGNRIASKIGTGGFEKMTRLCTLDQGPTYNANTLLNFVLYQVTNTTQPPTDEYPVDVCAGYSVATELLTNPLPDFYISQTNLNFTQNNLLQQFRQNLAGGTEPVYYFHSDHLGSASWITNGSGLPVQHLLYLPFGEHFVNEQSTGYNERFTFTGKERDAETGYYYHGARFNSSDWGWLSVDPMADKYPSLSPYAYCAWNPVKLVDPEGRAINPVYDFDGNFLGNTKNGFSGEPIITNTYNLEMCKDIYDAKTVEDLTTKQLLSNFGMTFDFAEKHQFLKISAQENIFRDIISKLDGAEIDGNVFDSENYQVKYYKNKAVNANIGVNVKDKTFYMSHNHDCYETTVENIQTTILYHEFFGHFINGWGNGKGDLKKSQGGEHYKCYQSVIESPMYSQTTKKFQNIQKKMLDYFKN